MIKDDIKELIEGYKKDFFEKTGLTIYCVEESGVFRLPIKKLIDKAEEHYSIPRGTLTHKTRKTNYVTARKAIIFVAREMNYGVVDIASQLNMDHSTISHHFQEARNEFRAESSYKTDFVKYKELLRKKCLID